jgi:hypothetical protein
VPKNYTSLVIPPTLKSLKLNVFSILPKNTKKAEKNSKKHIIYAIQTNIPPLITPITKSNKVFSILPNNKGKKHLQTKKQNRIQNHTKEDKNPPKNKYNKPKL